jgi:DNA-binding IscR family transcriptional regulator
MLAKERRRISMGEIVRAVRQFEGGSDPVETASGSRVGLEVVRPLWRQLQLEMLAKLDAVTLEDLCTKAQTAGIRSDAHQRLDFSI